jgi:hypothetical protein
MKYFPLTHPLNFGCDVLCSLRSDAKLFNELRSGFLQHCSNTATGFFPLLRSQNEGGKIQKGLNVTQNPVQDMIHIT